MNCAFCENPDVRNRTVIENGAAFAFPSMAPIVPGHLVITTKRHAKHYDDLAPEERMGIEDLRSQLRVALMKAFGAEGFNYAWNEEEVAGQAVPHFHLHILPRKTGDTGVIHHEPRYFLYHTGTTAVSPQEEIDEIVRIVKEALR